VTPAEWRTAQEPRSFLDRRETFVRGANYFHQLLEIRRLGNEVVGSFGRGP